MKPLQRVVWTEGMLMSPHHLQQADLYHEALLEERLVSVTPHAWGVTELELDEQALEAGQLLLRSFAGVLPHGTPVRFGAGDAEAPAARTLEGLFPAHQPSLDVYLALALERQGVPAYASPGRDASRARYLIEGRSVLDAVAQANEEVVEFAQRNLVLLVGEEAQSDYETLKIAELVRDRQGIVRFAETYVPPCLRVGSSRFLAEGFRRMMSACLSKRRAVAEERSQRDSMSAEFSAHEVTRYLALQALDGTIPVLKYIADTGAIAPLEAYFVLARLAGRLCSFTLDADPSTLPPYMQTDLRGTFEPLFTRVLELLRVAVTSRVVSIPLEARSDGLHLARVADELLKQGTQFVLSVQSLVPEHSVYELVPRVAKVASWRDIPSYVSSASSGVKLTPSRRPPREIATRGGKTYFLVATEHALWRSIVQEGAIAVHLPPPFDPKSTEVELLAIPAE